MSVLSILEELAADNSRLAKESILNREKGCNVLKQTVRLALDPLTQFHIRKIPKYAHSALFKESLAWGIGQLDILSRRQKTGNAAIDHLKFILENVSEKDALVIERIISKDLRCGVSVATANKIWPKLVHEFPCMLASGFEEKLVNKIPFPAYAQLKLDGMRCTAIVDNGGATLYSRNGKEIVLGDQFLKEFLAFGPGAYDGELLIKDGDKVVDRKTGNGILNKAVKGTISPQECVMVHMVMFDYIPLHDFYSGKSAMPYAARFSHIKTLLSNAPTPKISAVPSIQVGSLDEAQGYFAEMLEKGEEGIILKSSMNIWEDKRSKTQIKFKAELDCDLLCVGVEEGTGKNKGKMGALVLESAEGKLKVNVGTGFSDEDREYLWKNKPIGKVVAVCYNARISDKRTGVESLFLPRFLEVREDKTTPDKASKIK